MIDILRIKSKVSCWCPVTYINILLVDLIGQQNCCAVVSSAVMLSVVKNAKGDWCVSIRRQTNDREVSSNQLAEPHDTNKNSWCVCS